MTDVTDSMQAESPAAQTTTQAEHSPAQETHYQEQPAHESSPADYEDHFQDEPADLSEILDEARPKKLSGAQRAKLQRQYLESQLQERDSHIAAREQRIAELERHLSERDARDHETEAERKAEAQRRRDEAHLERINGAKGTITDWDRVLRKMDGVPVHMDVIDAIKESDKSELLTYHFANHPDKIQKLNSMSPTERAREIGRLEATLRMPEGKRQTSAPPPPTTLRGGAAPHAKLEDIGDMATFSKRLIKDLEARKRR